MPDVIGQQVAVATQTLHGDGLVIGSTTPVSSKKPLDTVLSTIPKPGKHISKGETVSLQVSLGRVTSPVTVPKLVGLSITQAQSLLNTDKLASKLRYTTTGTNPNNVLNQIPPPGTKDVTGDTVILIVLTPGSPFPLVSLAGDTTTAAANALGQFGLTVSGTTSTRCSNTMTTGLVVSTIPAAGAPVKAGAAIELVTSSGVCNVVVPNVVGEGQAAANSALTAQNLVGAFSDAPLGTCPVTESPGTVLTQSIAGGSSAPYGSTVNLTVCPGPLGY